MEYAGFMQRFVGALIDAVITLIISFICHKLGPEPIGVGLQLLYMLIDMMYYVLFWYFKNATLGMILMRIKIVSANNKPLTFIRLIVRYIGIFISLAVVGVGSLWMLWDKRRQTWQDKMAKTLVVKI